MGRGLVTQKRTTGGSQGPMNQADGSHSGMQGNRQNPASSSHGGAGGVVNQQTASNRQSIRSHSPGQNNFMQH